MSPKSQHAHAMAWGAPPCYLLTSTYACILPCSVTVKIRGKQGEYGLADAVCEQLPPRCFVGIMGKPLFSKAKDGSEKILREVS